MGWTKAEQQVCRAQIVRVSSNSLPIEPGSAQFRRSPIRTGASLGVCTKAKIPAAGSLSNSSCPTTSFVLIRVIRGSYGTFPRSDPRINTNKTDGKSEFDTSAVRGVARLLPRFGYCLSNTAVFVTRLPCAFVALVVTVRDFPSRDTTIRPVKVTFPFFLFFSSSVLLLTCV